MKKATIWRRFDSNTTPRGIGNPPTYYMDKPKTSEAEMVWAEEIPIVLPDGYEIAESWLGDKQLYDERGDHCPIIDNENNHPARADEYGHAIRLDKLADFRKLAELTQQEVADRIGISLAHYQKIEKGSSPLNKAGFETVQKLAATLNLTLDEMSKIEN